MANRLVGVGRGVAIVLVLTPAVWVESSVAGEDITPAGSGLAQVGAGDPAKPANPTGTLSSEAKLEEIIVTAQKRSENLQQVPISVQVIASQTLSEQNRNSFEDLTKTVPGVHVATGGFANNLFIRGIGSGGNPSFDQSAAMFADDIYRGRSRMSGATFLDLDHIEILKGPQSTYFGNNAIAGALSIVSKKPGDRLDASARALYGMFGEYVLEAAVGGPLTSVAGARLAIMRNGADRGWIQNVTTGEHVPRLNNLAGRLTLDFHPTEALDATLKIEGSQNRASGIGTGDEPTQWYACPPPAPYAPANIFAGACVNALALGVPVGLDNNRTPGLPGQYFSLSTFEDVLTINYHRWGHTFTSVTGFNNYHYNANGDNSILPTNPVGTNVFPEKYHQFSQELRLASPVDQPLEYLAGAYFQTDHLDWNQVFNATLLNPYAPPALAPYLPFASSGAFSQGEKVYSLFGAASWNLTGRLKLTAGLRASRVDKDFTTIKSYGTGTRLYGGFVPLPPALTAFPAIFFGAPGAAGLAQSNRALMPSAGIQYRAAPQVMAYFSYNRGFKAGGFNGDTTFGPIAHSEYGPEHVNAYELGLKSKWFGERLLVNADVFRSDYDGLQVTAATHDLKTGTWSYFINNAADSRSQGIELEMQWALARQFRLSANLTYLDAHYVNYRNGQPTMLQGFCAARYVLPYCSRFGTSVTANDPYDLSGFPLLYSPRWSGSVMASHSLLLLGNYKFTTELSPFFTSRYNRDPDGIFPSLGNYVRLDGRLSLEMLDGRWAIDVIGQNLTDKIIVTGGTAGPTTKERPRNVAAQFRYRY